MINMYYYYQYESIDQLSDIKMIVFYSGNDNI